MDAWEVQEEVNIECRLVPPTIFRIMGGILIYGGDEMAFVFDVVVTTLVCLAFIVLGFTYTRVEDSKTRAIIGVVTALYALCLIGMWF